MAARSVAAFAFAGALASWAVALVAFAGIWRNRGEVSAGRLAGAFLTSLRDLPPAAGPHVRRLAVAGAAFFAFVLLGMLAGLFSTP